MRILTYSSLYPNAVQPRHGIFIETRLRMLCAQERVSARVVAPVPWFPLRASCFGSFGVFARVPRHEARNGIAVGHPRYPVIPKVSWRFSPPLMAATTYSAVAAHASEIELIDAHFFYPDGVAAVKIGKRLGKPVVVTARGSDITLMTAYAGPRRAIQWAIREADALVTVCQALKDALVELGAPADKVTVLRNGVDLERFEPADREAARAALGLSGRVLLSVGNLVELKGNHLTLEALRDLPDVTLVLVGDGPERARLEALARQYDVADRVRFAGLVAQTELPRYYNAADALVLFSSREGWANVLLEAMACGTPVIATAIWGTPEVVAAPAAGVLADERSAAGLVAAYERLFAAYPERAATRAYAEGFSWDATSRGQYELFERVIAARGR
jgi:glycosyltransferase involved in cell wall biosynthesis